MRKRIPLTGSYNTRASAVNALSSSSGIVGIGIVGSMVVGQSARSSDKDVRYINCVPITVKDDLSQSQRVYVVKRPGFVSHTTPSAGNIGSAIHVWLAQGVGNKVITAFGAANSTIYDGTSSLGAITGKANGITETVLSGTPTLAISSGDSTGWYYQTVLTKISDGDFPGNAGRTLAGTFAHLDGYPFIMDSVGRIYNADLNSITAWTAGSYITANSISDVGVGAFRHRNTIIGFCKEHFDVFENAGNATGSPLQRIKELSQVVGAISADAITTIKDVVYFAGSTKEANVAIYAYDGGRAVPVSTPEIDAQLILAGPSNISLTATGFYGRHFIIVRASNTTFVYCVEEKNWHEWTSTTPLWYKADGVSVGSTMVVYSLSNISTTGKVFVFNPASISYRDNGSSYTATIQTAKLDLGMNSRKFWQDLDVIADRETTTSTLGISVYDDDYITASTVRNVDLSSARPHITRCGSSRRRSWTLTHSANTPMRIEALEIVYEVET